ncbi:MAG: META domain-containing protein [Chloroflexaceae bacterium]|nr:META domain-containing protein [Chloroflexaceae bacterium]
MTIEATPGSYGLIYADAPSPVDGLALASDAVSVLFGSTEPDIAVTINEPLPFATITDTVFTVSGWGKGLFEGNVVVQAQTSDGETLTQAPTTLQAAEVGGDGNWSIDLSIPPATNQSGFLVAFSPSPVDGQPMALFRIPVTFGIPVSDPASLERRLWVLRSYGPTGIETATLAGSEITLNFDSLSKRASGSGGCNTYTAGFGITGDRLALTPPASTRMICIDPPGIMEQEQAYFAMLEMVQRYEVQNERLQLITNDGQRMIFEAGPAPF